MNVFENEEIDDCIVTIDEILFKSNKIKSNDLNGLAEYLMDLVAVLALSTDLVSGAKYQLELKKREEHAKYRSEYLDKGKTLPPTIFKEMSESEAFSEIARLSKCERLNAAITHSIDAIRTLISKGKTELEMSKFSRG